MNPATYYSTYPPRGRHRAVDVQLLYTGFLGAVSRVLRPDGALVLLLAPSDPQWDAVSASGFTVRRRYDILLSGRKASAVRLDLER